MGDDRRDTVKAFFIGDISEKENIDWALKLDANVIFVGHESLKKAFKTPPTRAKALLRGGKVKLYIEFGLFASEDLWKKYPDCRPVDKKGKPMPKIHWCHGVCPNHSRVRKEKLQLIKSII